MTGFVYLLLTNKRHTPDLFQLMQEFCGQRVGSGREGQNAVDYTGCLDFEGRI